LAATCLTLVAWPAAAQTPPPNACAKRADLLNHLAGKFKEGRVAMGVADNGNLLEVFTAKDGSTWTVAMTLPNGITCLMATGQNWEAFELEIARGPRT
jgi:hypothetical protein